MTTGIVFSPSYLRHEQTPTHPERIERLSYTMDQIREEGIFDHPGIILLPPRKPTRHDILTVHSNEYLKFLEEKSISGGMIDYDTIIPPGLISDALLAVGGGIAGADAIVDQSVSNAFVLCRPPGHHAGRNRGAGFCYLNNAAIAVRHLQRRGIRKIMVIDWDAHHGNGTQEIFYDDPSVLYLSVHQFPFYPGSGQIDEIGEGEGEGYSVNMPIPAGSSDQVYQYLLGEIILPLAEKFMPDGIVISAGQDNHFTDPLCGLAMTAKGYAEMMREIVILADSICCGRLLVILEGGYSVEGGLPYTNLGIIAALAGLDLSGIREPAPLLELLHRSRSNTAMMQVTRMAADLKQVHNRYWNCFR
jgi:acetoin utilization deacetylase AcuC-like enzyme